MTRTPMAGPTPEWAPHPLIRGGAGWQTNHGSLQRPAPPLLASLPHIKGRATGQTACSPLPLPACPDGPHWDGPTGLYQCMNLCIGPLVFYNMEVGSQLRSLLAFSLKCPLAQVSGRTHILCSVWLTN